MMPVSRRLAALLERGTGRRVSACDALESRGVSSRSVQMRGTAQRTQRLKGRIAVRSRVDVQGATVVLIDDIITSGATMRRCVEALRSEGRMSSRFLRWPALRAAGQRKMTIIRHRRGISAG